MIDRPPRETEQSPPKISTHEQVALTLLKAREVLPQSESLAEGMLRLFSSDIEDEHINREKQRLEKWTHSVLNQETRRYDYISIENVSHDTAITSLIMRRARAFWKYGLSVIEDQEGMETWLAIVGHPQFMELTDRRKVYPEHAVTQKAKPSDKAGGGATGRKLFERIADVGTEDTDFITSMAAKMCEVATLDDTSTVSSALQQLASGFVTEGVSVAAGSIYVKVGNDSEKKEGMDARTFLAREVARHQEISLTGLKPSAALARLEFLEVTPQASHFLHYLRAALPDALRKKEPLRYRRESLDFVRGASRLLYSSLDFAARSQGPGSKNAALMYEYLQKTSSHHGRQTTPTRKALVVLANQITPLLREVLQEDDLPELDTATPFDTYFAIDRLFAFIEHEARSGQQEETVALLEVTADCALQLADYGLTEITTKIERTTPQQPETVLQNEAGPKRRRRALHRAGRPGYGRFS